MHGPVEREHAMMAMVTDGQRASTRAAPRLLDFEYKTCEYRIFRPAVGHDGPLPVQDVLGNHHIIDRHSCVLAFCRTIVYKRGRLASHVGGICKMPLILRYIPCIPSAGFSSSVSFVLIVKAFAFEVWRICVWHQLVYSV